MKSLIERNHTITGAVGVGVVAVLVAAGFFYDQVAFVVGDRPHSAYFSDASGLQEGADVQVAGAAIGKVTHIDLDGARVRVQFNVDKHVRLGERSEAAIKTSSLLGVKVLQIVSAGDGQLSQPIPLDRTKPAYELNDALSDLSTTIADLNTHDVNASLTTIAQEFSSTPPHLQAALAGITEFSQTLNARDQQLREMLSNAQNSTQVLASRTDEVVSLIVNTDALLGQLGSQSAALDTISADISALAHQLSAFLGENRAQLRPALDKLNGVLAIVDNRKEKVQESLKLLNPYLMSLGEAVSGGPFFKPYLANLLPGQFIQPFVDAAFSDLGLDPNVLLPSQRNDPQAGQPGTPALPVPYPRTGQGGEPKLTLPDAITGSPGDPRYPYHEPPPAPAPGGPPPGPPAPAPRVEPDQPGANR